MTAIAELVNATQTYFCLDCGVCTGSCPVAKVFPDFSPRQIIERSLYELEEPSDSTIWSCLTCAQCSVRCPANIDFPEFVRLIRDEARALGYDGVPAHNGMLQTITAIQTEDVQQNRTFWVEDGKTVEKGDVFYFVGCRPYFDVIFRDIDAGSIQSARNVLKLLNGCGVEPVVSNEERCCGHDALWNGNEDKFKALAEINLDIIRDSGAKQVVFSCPEGYHTFKEYYPRYFGELEFEPIHILDFLAGKIEDGTVALNESPATVTYHDPCRLGRLAGIYDAPRALIEAMPGVELVEMPRSRENGVCCGTTGWMNCSSCSKEMQMQRLAEAGATGAGTLITACPKCQIHFRCAKAAFDLDIEINDLYDMIAERIK
ncbi:MAG: (Fe-S)-binding protein [Deltaproteobacteria bacterium]|nr:(Fe-S)-binding protein [Deltaproteobacteria bacterium]MBW1815945.1 (Fe-S)-binding protein [Deltaproteobacteria bacterium]MBW2283305.1 (Fe-S)-binding protein [Deltaproteobacteria bacterium]